MTYLPVAFVVYDVWLARLGAALRLIGGGLLAIVFLSLSLCLASVVKAEPVALAPYRAVYEITLEEGGRRLAQPAALRSLSGRMVYELMGSSCEGYSMTQRLVTAADMVEGGRILEDLQMAGFEDIRAGSFEFVSRRLIGDKLAQKQRGVASLKGDKTELTLREPRADHLTLPHKVLFPISFQKALIKAALKGERLFSAHLFDGADKVGTYYHTTSTIGPEATSGPGAAPESGPLEALGKMKRWPLTIAYFQASEQSEAMTPLYELSTILFENGVSGSLRLVFSDYVMRATLKSIDMLPVAECP
nr:DUF1849 family protein [uncultured Cohaesibacter sp.]